MRIVPPSNHSSTFKATNTSAPSAPGVHDVLRHGIGPNTSTTTDPIPASRHPLEARLKAWESTQETLRMESLRKTFGVAEPVRRGMELKIARDGDWRPLALGGGVRSVHEDILRGREAAIDWEDVFTGEEQRAAVGVHEEMERKLKI
ncbi:proteasome maturation factor UMP1 [Hypoxylon trugodes]|uniref:proteasome maturation factor UMP1 n=1 Tax=Hypoxylon trugodes TaxID=326681 RepID=UPI002199BB7C|nr:proteasome maturation factor UMP1 [Hypoxylon trugodes]KAI1383629.1 proteasome maturation factor UMP1 [Hypoxylon trugodes]